MMTLSHSGLINKVVSLGKLWRKKSNSNVDHNILDVLFYRKAILVR